MGMNEDFYNRLQRLHQSHCALSCEYLFNQRLKKKKKVLFVLSDFSFLGCSKNFILL